MEPRKACESEHDFTLVLAGVVDLEPRMEDALFEAGCDDATYSVRSGRPFLTFSRVASTLREAIVSAINDVHKANIGAWVLRVDVCDLVTQADIARKTSRSRQSIHQYITGERGPGGFPSPVCGLADDHYLWYWCEVSYWLQKNDMIKEDAFRESMDVSIINNFLETQHYRNIDPMATSEIGKLIVSA